MSHDIVLSKLKRNGIKGKYLASENELILGGGSRDPGLLITGIIFLAITALTLVLTGAGIMPYLGRITIYIIGISIFAGVTMLGIYEKKKRNNKNTVRFASGQIDVSRKELSSTITSGNIQEITCVVESAGAQQYEGKLVLTAKDGNIYTLLGMIDADKKALGSDLEFIKAYIVELVKSGQN